MPLLSIFLPSIIVTLIGFILGYFWGGLVSLVIIILLSILEISLSFDNALINAKILQKMSVLWQKRFLTFGIIIAVFGVRIIFPILVVSMITGIGFIEILIMAFRDPSHYFQHLVQAHTALVSFGGMFLWMVFITFIFDAKRSVFWLGTLEEKLSRLGHVPLISMMSGLIVLLILQVFLAQNDKLTFFIAGLLGIFLFILMHSFIALLEKNQKLIKQGIVSFIYLELLDASFSMDGVLGAFAITKDLILIIIGLTIGAMFVRSITIYVVHRKTLQKYLYLEHGAHYAIGVLAILMLLSIILPISELLTGCIGVIVIALSLLSSMLENKTSNLKR